MNDKRELNGGVQIILGILIGILYIGTPNFIGSFFNVSIGLILIMLILAVTIVMSIKLVKDFKYKPLGITLLVISVPYISILLLFGACFVIFSI